MEDRNDSWTHTVQLDGENDCETQMEEQAVALAVATGACDRCCWLPTCCTRDDFAPPSDAWCMVKKAELIKEKSKKG